ncbi:hypothetical protein MDUV_25920 [Mycolicibacterium duvalii]|uniref:Uncharacterized protein n=1 Tax=Mycolicibacterium duvalii TaxID=39688 RepID=A0A7I7K2X6_9MYCO|nr:hypothetical protein MDUV_25920 [Mycolicibacterium duvalii]
MLGGFHKKHPVRQGEAQSELLRSASDRVVSFVAGLAERQTLLDSCPQRAARDIAESQRLTVSYRGLNFFANFF